MRWIFRWLFRLLLLLVVLVVAAILLLDTIAREIAEYRIQRQTGLEVKIGRMDVGLLRPRLTIENLIIYNSAEFGGSPLLDMPELRLEFDRNPLFNSHFNFKLIRLNLARLNVVESKSGKKNLELLGRRLGKPGQVTGAPSGPAKAAPPAAKGFPKIETLNLSLGRATFMSMKEPAKTDELKLDVRNQVFTDVTSAAQMENILLVVVMSRYNVLGGEGKAWLQNLGLNDKP